MSKQPKRDRTKEIGEELDALDIMLSALVEILEEKGVITQKEWEQRIEAKMRKARGLRKYRELQFPE
jgi:hypothetical protein